MIEDFRDLSGIQLDALKEIGNIGAGNAATALAQMTQVRIDMSVPQVGILPFDKVAYLVGGPDTPVVGVYFQVTGSANCNILFILSIEMAVLLAELLMGRPTGNIWDNGDVRVVAAHSFATYRMLWRCLPR